MEMNTDYYVMLEMINCGGRVFLSVQRKYSRIYRTCNTEDNFLLPWLPYDYCLMSYKTYIELEWAR